ncbi:MAG: ABC transporter ATP-binding protein [Lachnospiraceae bacterium]|nr:ABC transporter ATP-binding protein [Lachnospiraceae bacterium]
MNLLEVKDITKQYKNFTLDHISFSIPAGYIMGYIGQNGAGKTTTLNIITQLIHAASGTVSIDGLSLDEDPIAYRDKIGYIGDSSYYPEELTLRQIKGILKDFYSSFQPEVFDQYQKKWNLPDQKKIKEFSRGMKVKLMFASVLSRDTRLLVLDEATNGLDPVMRKEILTLLQEYISDGKRSVLFSTHILEDLEQIADYIFFIEKGKKVLCDSKDELLESYLLVKGGPEDLTEPLKHSLIGLEVNSFGFEALLSSRDTIVPSKGLLTARPSIDQILLHMILERKR